MALTPTTSKGTVGIVVESISGEQQVMAPTAVASTMNSGITQPTAGAGGVKFIIVVKNYTASGTFTINATAVVGSDSAVTVAAPTAQQTQGGNYSFVYVSIGNYSAFTSLTTTGLTNALIEIRAVQATKYDVPATKYVSKRKTPPYSPNEFSGFMARDKKLIATLNDTSIDSFDSDFYGDLSMYWPFVMLGIPTWTTLPASPLSVVASATLTATLTIANQPTAPGMRLIFVITSLSGTPTITITGTQYGLTVTEAISPTANGTYYSAYVYSAITSIASATNSTNVVVTGVFGWLGTANSEGTRQTLNEEFYDGSGSYIHPFSYFTDGEMSIKTNGAASLTLKGMAQNKLPIGPRTTNPLQVSRVTSLGVPLTDLPIAGWQTQVYLDDITGTSGTTIFLDADEEIKIAVKAPVESHHTFNNSQAFSRAYPQKPECTVDVTYDIINLLQSEIYRQNLAQYLVVKLLGQYIGTTGGTAYNKGWTWTLPVQYEEYNEEADVSKGNTFAKPKLRTRYDAGIGASYQLQIVTQQPPNYNS